jgi:hypothetical protein
MSVHLREFLDAECDAALCNLDDLTVLSSPVDPYRQDTPKLRRWAEWFATHAEGLGRRHLRGFHYIFLSCAVPGPEGEGLPYNADHRDYKRLEKGAKAARWLGLVPFDQVADHRIRIRSTDEPFVSTAPAESMSVPTIEGLKPRAELFDFDPVQRFRLAICGEKSSLEPVLGPVADLYNADLFLPTGEISDTQAWLMAKAAVDDGRPLVALYFADCDPSGWNMPISLARKLQAFRQNVLPELVFRIHRVGVLPAHVIERELPETPLSEQEARAEDWEARQGVSQTEIDSIAVLQPEVLRKIARDAISPWFDYALNQRAGEIGQEYENEVQAMLDVEIGDDYHAQAGYRLDLLREEAKEIANTLQEIVEDIEIPEPPDLPEAELHGEKPEALITSDEGYREATRRLIRDKEYRL